MKNYEQLVRSFAFHYRRRVVTSEHLVTNKSAYEFAKYFYDMCIKIFGMNLFDKYDWKSFDGGENFFKQTNQKVF